METKTDLKLMITDVVGAYKGSARVSDEKLQRMRSGFKRNKWIKIRPHERILFSTDMFLYLQDLSKVNILISKDLAIEQGLQLITPEVIFSDKNEVRLLIHNPSDHLCELEMGKEIAKIEFL